MKRYVMSRTQGRVLCVPANHPTRRAGASRQQAERIDPSPLQTHPDEEVVGYIEDTRKIGGARTW